MDTARYVGMNCPYCRSALTAEDDIVICSVCDTPHHRDCWSENNGCTVFGCTGVIKGEEDTQQNFQNFATENSFPAMPTVNQSAVEIASIISMKEQKLVCSRCEKIHSIGDNFCANCGQKLWEDRKLTEVSSHCCSICGKHADPADTYCANCGRKFTNSGNLLTQCPRCKTARQDLRAFCVYCGYCYDSSIRRSIGLSD